MDTAKGGTEFVTKGGYYGEPGHEDKKREANAGGT
jgi:hypothetical protein